jgi:hypothetical protein
MLNGVVPILCVARSLGIVDREGAVAEITIDRMTLALPDLEFVSSKGLPSDVTSNASKPPDA